MIKILLAEDDKFFLALYKSKLVDDNFEISTVENGELAIKYLEENIPNIIILDLIMPVKDGFEVIEYIKSQDKLKNIPLIVFSSLTQESDIDKAKTLGANDYFDKSTTDFKTLKDKIKFLTATL